ncbi:MAG: M3 family oligoendopeptidase [Bacilli bacterium]
MKFEEMLYKRPNYEEVKTQLNALYNQLKEASNPSSFFEVFNSINDVRSTISTMKGINSIRNSIDVNNTFELQEKAYWDEMDPSYQELEIPLFKILLACPFKKELADRIPELFFTTIESQSKVFSEVITKEVLEENKLITEYENIFAKLMVQYNGQDYRIAAMAPFINSVDRSIRKSATEALNKAISKYQELLDTIYDKLVHLRDTSAKKLGFKNFVEMAYLIRNRIKYDSRDVANLRSKVLEYATPFTTKQAESRRIRLGLDELYYYDNIMFKTGNPKPKGTETELVNKALQMYKGISKEVSVFFNEMLNNNLITLTDLPNKKAGGYCCYLLNYKCPFIFATFNGTTHDVNVLTHEFGHALQSYNANNKYKGNYLVMPETVYPSMEVAEIFSVGMEMLTLNYMDSFYLEDTAKNHYLQLESAVTFLPYGCLVDHFQQEVYENPNMTPKMRRDTWRKLEKLYCPHINYADNAYLESGTYWFRQSHIFTSPFYYIDYVIAYISALEIWKNSKIDFQNTWTNYIELGYKANRYPYIDLIKMGNLSNPFTTDILKYLVKEVETDLSKIDTTDL